eukprot:1683238-Pyramimonas_sp.AAC.2
METDWFIHWLLQQRQDPERRRRQLAKFRDLDDEVQAKQVPTRPNSDTTLSPPVVWQSLVLSRSSSPVIERLLAS